MTISKRASGGWPRRSASDVTSKTVPLTHRGSRPAPHAAPEAPPALAGVAGRGHELVGVRDVGRDRERDRVALAHEREVDEQVVVRPVDVGEQAAVAVARLDVADQANRGALRQQRLACAPRPRARSTRRACPVSPSRACRCPRAGPARRAPRSARGWCRRRRRARRWRRPARQRPVRRRPRRSCTPTADNRRQPRRSPGGASHRASSLDDWWRRPEPRCGGTLRRVRGWCRCRGRRRSTW